MDEDELDVEEIDSDPDPEGRDREESVGPSAVAGALLRQSRRRSRSGRTLRSPRGSPGLRGSFVRPLLSTAAHERDELTEQTARNAASKNSAAAKIETISPRPAAR